MTYCLASPSLQLGQVQATRRRRGLVAVVPVAAATAAASVVVMTTSMVVSGCDGEDTWPVPGAADTVTI